jgi:holin-like protein
VLESLAVLLFCQLIGELIVIYLDIPVPGPVVGMLLLFVGLMIRGNIPEPLAQSANGLLEQLSLMFVPAGVGVMTHLTLLGKQWLPLTASLVISTLLTIAVTGLLMQKLARKDGES